MWFSWRITFRTGLLYTIVSSLNPSVPLQHVPYLNSLVIGNLGTQSAAYAAYGAQSDRTLPHLSFKTIEILVS